MLRVGLTGGLGSGKSTVGRMFAELGAAVIDADEVGRSLMQPGQPVFDRIVEHFGEQVVRTDGSLDRRALAELAFDGGQDAEQNRRELLQLYRAPRHQTPPRKSGCAESLRPTPTP